MYARGLRALEFGDEEEAQVAVQELRAYQRRNSGCLVPRLPEVEAAVRKESIGFADLKKLIQRWLKSTRSMRFLVGGLVLATLFMVAYWHEYKMAQIDKGNLLGECRQLKQNTFIYERRSKNSVIIDQVFRGDGVVLAENFSLGSWVLVSSPVRGYVEAKNLLPDCQAIPKVALRLNSKGPAVAELQTLLRNRGYTIRYGADGSGRGEFGMQTLTAVRAFQQDVGLAVDGVAGPRTMAVLRGGENARPTQATTSSGAVGRYIISTDSNKGLNVRTGPGSQYGIATSLSNGTGVNVSGIENGWAQIAPGRYVSTRFLRKEGELSVSCALIEADNVRIYENASDRNPTRFTLDRDDIIFINGDPISDRASERREWIDVTLVKDSRWSGFIDLSAVDAEVNCPDRQPLDNSLEDAQCYVVAEDIAEVRMGRNPDLAAVDKLSQGEFIWLADENETDSDERIWKKRADTDIENFSFWVEFQNSPDVSPNFFPVNYLNCLDDN